MELRMFFGRTLNRFGALYRIELRAGDQRRVRRAQHALNARATRTLDGCVRS